MWNRGVSVKRISRVSISEFVFLILVLFMGYIYLSEPARKESWEQIRWKWRVLQQMLSLKEGIRWFPPLDSTMFQWPSLARFGEELELIGCDRIGNSLVTLWRAHAPLSRDYTLYVHFVKLGDPRPFFSQADHLLGQYGEGSFRPTTQWQPGEIMVDITPLPPEVEREPSFSTRVGVWIPETGFRLQPQTEILYVDQYGRLEICSSSALPEMLENNPQWSLFKEMARDPHIILVSPFDWSTVKLNALARWEDRLEFLGCDVAITRNRHQVFIWQVTIWRALAPLDHDLQISLWLARSSREVIIEHYLGQQLLDGFSPTHSWEPGQVVLDVTPVPQEFNDLSAVELRIRIYDPLEKRYLRPQSDLLSISREWVTICR